MGLESGLGNIRVYNFENAQPYSLAPLADVLPHVFKTDAKWQDYSHYFRHTFLVVSLTGSGTFSNLCRHNCLLSSSLSFLAIRRSEAKALHPGVELLGGKSSSLVPQLLSSLPSTNSSVPPSIQKLCRTQLFFQTTPSSFAL